MADRVGQQFGNYRLIQLLGSGGFAEVYLAEHRQLGMKAAIKILHAHLERSEISAFRQEARTIADLKHPHILRVLDFDVENATPFLVLDYASKGSLRVIHPRESRLPLDLVVNYVGQIANALQYAHERKLIHRDVKPENILMGEDGRLLLSDFGIATIVHSTSSMATAAAMGTLAYMAPEQIQGKPRPQSDQYALAVMTYHWLTGALPFQGSPAELIAQHLRTPPSPLRTHTPDLPVEVEQVVLTALAKDLKERFVNLQAFAVALEQAGKSRRAASLPPQALMPPSTPVSDTSGHKAASATVQPMINTPAHQPLAASGRRDILPARDITPSHSPTSLIAANTRLASRRLSRRALLTVGSIGLGAVAVGGAFFALAEHPSASKVYKTSNISLLPKNLLVRYQGHASASPPSLTLIWSPDGTRILSTDSKTTVQAWNAFDGKHASLYHISDPNADRPTLDLAWTQRGPCLALTYGTTRVVHVIDVTTGQEITSYNGQSAAVDIAWSPDGTRIVEITVFTVQVWNAMNGQGISSFTPSVPPGPPQCPVWRGLVSRLYTHCSMGCVVWFHLYSGRCYWSANQRIQQAHGRDR